ncbi:hypothetical protein JXA12_01150 [Candidatus Woesearchaeota archaeon]|nr:hypothetical protein [Candidatus Woesearchaeota archaeon]
MVITEADLENMAPAERIKALRRLQMEKRKELEELQEQKSKEIAEVQSRLERSLEDLELEEERVREEEGSRRQQRENRPLEESVAEAPVSETPGQGAGPATYGSALERLMPGNLQDLSDYNLYGELRSLEEKGYLTPDEQRRVADLQRQAEGITAAYSRRDRDRVDEQRGHYLSRTENVLKRLQDKMHDLSGGLYDLNKRDHDAVYQ